MTPQSAYPQVLPFVWRGCVVAAIAGLFLQNLVIGFAIGALLPLAALVWRTDQLPVVAFCVGYQWLFVVTGYTTYLITGEYPGLPVVGSIEPAILFSILGLAMLALGFRLTTQSINVDAVEHAPYRLDRLFWLVIGLFLLDWVIELNFLNIPYQFLHPFRVVLKLRYLFLFLLLIEVQRTKQGYQTAVAAFFIALLPKLLTGMATFKEPVFFLAILLVSRLSLRPTNARERAANRRVIFSSVSIAALLLIVGMVWSHELKIRWRLALWRGEVVGSPVEKLVAFSDMLSLSLSRFEFAPAAQKFSSRLSSGVGYFSHVVDRVPAWIPHENGSMAWRGVQHVMTPRFLFPDKPSLGGDSWIVRKYAGLWVSGDEQGTSVGLGYIGEFYIDYGVLGVTGLCFLFGMYYGLLYRVVWRVSPSRQIASAFSVVLMLDYMTGYEANFAKTLGGMTQTLVLFVGLMWIVGPLLQRYLAAPGPTPAIRTGIPEPKLPGRT